MATERVCSDCGRVIGPLDWPRQPADVTPKTESRARDVLLRAMQDSRLYGRERQRIEDAADGMAREAASKAVAEVAAGSMRVSADDIRKALANLRGPVTRDESIVMACAQAILWELDARDALIASERKP